MAHMIDFYTQDGIKKHVKELDATVFTDDEATNTLVYDYLRLQRNNARIAIADVKTRAEVAGSGKKPYRQKGNGSGRAGSKRSPTRRHGGVNFGPSADKNWDLKMPKKAKKKAMAGIILHKVQDGEVIGLETMTLSTIKTKEANTIIMKLPCVGTKLVVLPTLDGIVAKSLRNIAGVSYVAASYINPYAALTHKNIIFLGNALDVVTETLKR